LPSGPWPSGLKKVAAFSALAAVAWMRRPMSNPQPPQPPSSQLIERLNAVQREHQNEPARKRRTTLAQEIEQQLAGLPPAERVAVVEQALGAIRPSRSVAGPAAAAGGEDRAFSERLDAAVAETEALLKERDGLRTTRDALMRENGKLRAQLDAPAPAGSSGGSHDAFRSGLKEAFEGRKVDPVKLGLPASDVRMFRLPQELMVHVQMLDIIRIEVLNKLDIGAVGKMRTVLLEKYKQEIRKQILAVLNDQEGSVRKLRESLEAQKNFILGIPQAVESAVPIAMAALLAVLAPDPILARSKKIMIDHQRAWEDFTRLHSDLSNQSNEEFWDNYFKDAFREKLSAWTKDES
jgi:hypothetical protein